MCSQIMKTISLLLLIAMAPGLRCFGDMGSLPFTSGVRIVEPRQDAIIAWNGKEQLLYLQTTLAASEETKVLEVMPLPSKPEVEAGHAGVFERCQAVLPKVLVADSEVYGPFGIPDELPAATVVERKTIGIHHLQTVELHDAARFSEWVKERFGGEGLVIPAPLLEVIEEYAKDDYRWFLFDVIEVTKDESKKTPLRIRFKSDMLYYPMRITRTEEGDTTVSLSVLTNVLFNKEDCVGIPKEAIKVPVRPVEILGTTVKWIDPPLYELLGRPQVAQLRTWEVSGEIDSFQKDILVRNPAAAKKKAEEVGAKTPISESNAR